jgi:hypothetical protein
LRHSGRSDQTSGRGRNEEVVAHVVGPWKVESHLKLGGTTNVPIGGVSSLPRLPKSD